MVKQNNGACWLHWQRLFAVIILLIANQASFAGGSCTLLSVSTTANAFGSYNPFSPTATDSTGNVRVTCSLVGLLLSYSVALNTGTSGTYLSRAMSDGNGHQINYNLYTDASRTTVWGNGTSGTSVVNGSMPLAIFAQTINHTVYGRIPALQNAYVGSYSDTVTVTVTF